MNRYRFMFFSAQLKRLLIWLWQPNRAAVWSSCARMSSGEEPDAIAFGTLWKTFAEFELREGFRLP